ncbi:Obp59a [Drosophila busckii]|uniref:Obp59a n=1 Tax=Drosophila busckii TaxID=30019 RepID=A0A0M4EE34_DROBS|nr:Obp59a [Drosophila busckii]
MKLPLLLFTLISCCCCGIRALRCRSQDGPSEAELKRVVRSCMQRNGNNNNQDDNERRYGNQRNNFDSSYANNQDYGYAQAQGQGSNNQQQQQSYGNRWQRSLKQSDMGSNNNNNNNNKGNNTSEMGQCVSQCFFEELNMIDANGQPDRRKVSYLLTKDIRDRELRNFYMDTVQQCFRYLEQSQSRYNNNNNRCRMSRELIKCMSEYARAQCDDWEEHDNILFN